MKTLELREDTGEEITKVALLKRLKTYEFMDVYVQAVIGKQVSWVIVKKGALQGVLKGLQGPFRVLLRGRELFLY